LSDNFIAINHDLKRFARGLYAKQNEGERELDSRETERERQCINEGRSSISTNFNILA
jgi:hypothetical protein